MIDHTHLQRVYYADTDAGGVVYHAAYLDFAERARTEALRDAGLPHATLIADHGLVFVVRTVEVAYRRPARLDDLLAIRTRPTACASASVTLRQTIAGPDGALVCTLAVGLVCVTASGFRPARIPRAWALALTPATA